MEIFCFGGSRSGHFITTPEIPPEKWYTLGPKIMTLEGVSIQLDELYRLETYTDIPSKKTVYFYVLNWIPSSEHLKKKLLQIAVGMKLL